MREILFRGKDFLNKWRYGSLLINRYGEPYIYIPDDKRCYLIDLNTAGQYTGLKDVNGNYVFEGDILQHVSEGEKCLAEVTWDEGMFFLNNYCETFYEDIKEAPCQKIVGNRYDNPELVEIIRKSNCKRCVLKFECYPEYECNKNKDDE